MDQIFEFDYSILGSLGLVCYIRWPKVPFLFKEQTFLLQEYPSTWAHSSILCAYLCPNFSEFPIFLKHLRQDWRLLDRIQLWQIHLRLFKARNICLKTFFLEHFLGQNIEALCLPWSLQSLLLRLKKFILQKHYLWQFFVRLLGTFYMLFSALFILS